MFSHVNGAAPPREDGVKISGGMENENAGMSIPGLKNRPKSNRDGKQDAGNKGAAPGTELEVVVNS